MRNPQSERRANRGGFREKVASLEDALQEAGGVYVPGGMFAPNAVRDGSLITGQNPGSSVKAAELCCEALALCAKQLLGRRYQALVAGDAVRADHHEDGMLDLRLSSQVLWHADCLTEKFTLLLKRRIVHPLGVSLVQSIFFEIAPEVSNQGLPRCILLQTLKVDIYLLSLLWNHRL